MLRGVGHFLLGCVLIYWNTHSGRDVRWVFPYQQTYHGQKSQHPSESYCSFGHLLTGVSWTKFTESVKLFIPEHLNNLPGKIWASQRRISKTRNIAHIDINDETYLAAFLAIWLSGRIFGDSSIAVWSEGFLVVVRWLTGNDMVWPPHICRGPTDT